jgi:hypothetical protein
MERCDQLFCQKKEYFPNLVTSAQPPVDKEGVAIDSACITGSVAAAFIYNDTLLAADPAEARFADTCGDAATGLRHNERPSSLRIEPHRIRLLSGFGFCLPPTQRANTVFHRITERIFNVLNVIRTAENPD